MTDKPKTLLGALALALPTIGAAKKNATNPHFKANYADLGAVIEAIRPIAEHGIWFRQVSHETERGVSVETFYIHETGELSAGKVFVPADKANAQGYGSAQTYARRYGLQLAFGLATEDDDGNAAAAAPPQSAKKLVTTAQADELTLLFDQLNVPVADFLKVAEIDALDKLPAGWFDRAKKWVNDKAAEKRKALAEELDDEINF